MIKPFHTLGDVIVTPFVERYLDAVASMPEEQGVARLEKLVLLIIRFTPRLRKTAIRNLEFVFPELSSQERQEIAFRSYRVLAENLYWFAKMPRMSEQDIRDLFDYSEAAPIYEEITQRQTGGLIVTAHFGIFELVSQAQAVYGQPYGILHREFGMPKLDRLWRLRREHFGSELFSRKGAFQEMVRRLKAGQDVAVLFDQNIKIRHAAFVEFFGLPAATTKAIGYAALKSECTVVFASALKNPPGAEKRFKIVARKIPNPSTEEGTQDEKVERFLRRLHIELEGLIRISPESWFWIHRRWKTRPNGEEENFYK